MLRQWGWGLACQWEVAVRLVVGGAVHKDYRWRKMENPGGRGRIETIVNTFYNHGLSSIKLLSIFGSKPKMCVGM